MNIHFAPTGYINICDAARNVAKIREYTAVDFEYLETQDRLNDAEALSLATKSLRQALCDGNLKAYTMDSSGIKLPVPAWAWVDDKSCMGDQGIDVLFWGCCSFHPGGLKLDGNRAPVFISEKDILSFQTDNLEPTHEKLKPAPDKVTKRAGRPKGVGSFNDEKWLDRMKDIIVKDCISPWSASVIILSENLDEIMRKTGSDNSAVAYRLYKKYISSDRSKSPSD
jgi:hypothetical protein